MIDVKNCRLVIFEQRKDERVDSVNLTGVLYSDENVRILKIFDIAATPENGCDIVRVDIYR